MSLSQWWSHLRAHLAARFLQMVDSRSSRRRLALEFLEGREVLSGLPTVNYAVDQSWTSGFQAQMSIQNPSAAPALSSWRLEFDYSANITSIWDARIVSRNGNHYVLQDAGWNAMLASGGGVSFGFIGGASGTVSPPTNYLLNGLPLGGVVPPVLPTLSVADMHITEGNTGTTLAAFTVRLSAPAGQTISVHYTTADGTAKATSDYQPMQGSLTFAPGETAKTVSVPVSGDTTVEPDETFFLQLNSPIGATLTNAQASATLFNDDLSLPPPLPPVVQGNLALQVTTDWGTGFQAEVQVRNTGSTTINHWIMEFDYAPTISSIWNARIVSRTGTRYVIEGAAWNANLAAGATTAFGFVADGTSNAQPTNILLRSPSGATSGSTGGTTPGTGSGTTSFSTITWPTQFFAPFVDMAGWPTPDLVNLSQATGVKFFTLAFIVAHNATGEPSWGGYEPYRVHGGEFDLALRTQINNLRALGGDVMVSFGGAANQELAMVIPTVSALTQGYQKVIDAYGLTRIDFDIEGAAVADRASIDRRSQAMAALQSAAAAAGRNLDIWLTLPVLPTGLTADGLYVVQSAVRAGVRLAGVNIMAMDYGDSAAPNPQGRMGDYAIEAAQSLFAQLRGVYGTLLSDSQLWRMVGVTPMIGVNDVVTEVFDQTEARELLAFAQQQGLGMLSMWSLTRDRYDGPSLVTSSAIPQQPFEFSGIFNPFTR